jgi:hypothetical protein
MTKRSLVVALTIFGVLAAASAASAECAWVLWREEETKLPDRETSVEWVAPVAFADRAACVESIDYSLSGWRRDRMKPNQSLTREPGGSWAEYRTRFENRNDAWIATRFRCLPDTVDPRGPKGSK